MGAACPAFIASADAQHTAPGKVIERLLSGYAYVDHLLTAGLDPFAYGGSRLLLEMNHRVLCGVTPERRVEFDRHIEATEKRFYDDHECGADAFYAWVAGTRGLGARAFAAGAFVCITSRPQLFIEGNQRTATLVASYILSRAGLPPLVVTPAMFADYRSLTDACKGLDRQKLWSVLSRRALETRLQHFIACFAEARFRLNARRPDCSSSAPGATSE